MSKFYYSLIVAIFFLTGCKTPLPEGHYKILQDVHIVDVSSGKILYDQNLIIKDSIIFDITDDPSKYLKVPGALAIQTNSKYVLPGLWDMHFHLCWDERNDSIISPALFRYGITGIRDMGGSLSITNSFKKDAFNNPRIYGAGPIIDGDPPVFYDVTIPIGSKEQVRPVIDSLISNGVDFIKVYSLLRKDVLEEIRSSLKGTGIPYSGHLSELVSPENQIEGEIKSIEHLNVLEEIWASDTLRIGNLIQLMKHNETFVCPTLELYRAKSQPSNDIYKKEFLQNVPPMLVEEWLASRSNTVDDSIILKNKKRLFDNLELVQLLNENGVKILAGSDFGGIPFVYPGIGLHNELSLLARSGLTNLEVIQAATINATDYMRLTEELGSIAVGKFADVIVVNNNPLINLNTLRDPVLVFKNGELKYSKDNPISD